MNRNYHKLRRSAGAALLAVLIGLPFLRVNNESAFRFDVPTLRLLVFGTGIELADSFIILIALIFLTLLVLFVTTLFGRIWCGWLCPQTLLCDATSFLEKTRRSLPQALTMPAAVLVSGLISFSVVGYFVSPYDLPALLRINGMTARIVVWSWAALTVLLSLDLILLRRNFCATVCPYARMQSVLFDDKTLLVAYDPARAEECMGCKACVKACPVGIDIRNGTQMACIHCAECIDACSARTAVKGRSSLIHYSWGVPGAKQSGFRINPLLTGILAAAFLLFLLYLSASRMPFDLSVRLQYTAGPQIQADGGVANLYELSFRNMTSRDLTVNVEAVSAAASVIITPSRVVLPRGSGFMRLPFRIILKQAPTEGKQVSVTITATAPNEEKSIARDIYFLLPGKD